MDLGWQVNFNTLQERNRYILKNELRADCCFLAGEVPEDQRLFHAHKYPLANASPVFERMFFGALPEKNDDPIEVPDIEAVDFQDLLQFIYTDEIEFFTVDRAQRLYCAADKYMLIPLKQKCIEFLTIEVKNNVLVCEMFEFSKTFEEKNLEEACKNRIRNDTAAVLNSPSFFNADISTLNFILDQNKLSINSELVLFTALEKYGNYWFPMDKRVDCKSISQIYQQQKSDSSTAEEDKNEKTQDAVCQKIEPTEQFLKLFRKIRFLTLTVDQFANGPAFSKWISESDAFKILVCLANSKKRKDHFPIGFSLSEERR